MTFDSGMMCDGESKGKEARTLGVYIGQAFFILDSQSSLEEAQTFAIIRADGFKRRGMQQQSEQLEHLVNELQYQFIAFKQGRLMMAHSDKRGERHDEHEQHAN